MSPVESHIAQAAECLQAGRPADAVPWLRQATALRPADARLQHDLGLACLESGALDESIAAFRRAIAADPRYAQACMRMAIALERRGDGGAALAAYDRATELQPSLTEAWFRAGALAYTLGHRDAAIGCFSRAAATGATSRFGKLGAARALLTQDRNVEAEAALRRLLASDPADAMAHDLLGNVLAEAGRFGEAYECFAHAVRIAPLMAGSYYDLVRCRPVTAAEAGLPARIAASLETPGLEVEQRVRVHLAAGKAADDLKDYELAMRHFDAADALRPASASFDATAFGREVDTLIERCTPQWLARAPQPGSSDRTPVLILGMPRSGTTLVEQIISSHPQVRAGGELNFWNERGAAWHAGRAAQNEESLLTQAAAEYLALLKSLGPKAARVTDKMPFNFLWAGLIHRVLPHATIIHCRRAAIDTALSIHQTLFHPTLALPTGGQKLVDYFRSYERISRHWRAVLPPDRYLEVSYEELTRAPQAVIRRLIEGCSLPWDDACLHPEKNARAVKTPSKWQTRQPIYGHSVERWRRYEPWLGALRALT